VFPARRAGGWRTAAGAGLTVEVDDPSAPPVAIGTAAGFVGFADDDKGCADPLAAAFVTSLLAGNCGLAEAVSAAPICSVSPSSEPWIWR